MIRKEIMDIVDKCINEDRELLRRLANEEFANRKILLREQTN